MNISAAVEVIMRATGRSTLQDGLDWIARDARLAADVDPHRLLRAIVSLPESDDSQAALRRLTKVLTASNFDSATFLFDPDTVERPQDLERALLEIEAHAPAQQFANTTDSALIAAQRVNPRAIEALCYAAGMSYGELRTRVDDLPSDPRRSWTPSQVRAAFKQLDIVIRGTERVEMPGAVGVRPLELLVSRTDGDQAWEALQHQLHHGVSLGVLLAQRAEGGTWLARRNRYSSRLKPVLLASLGEELDELGITHVRSTTLGGRLSVSKMQQLTRSDKQIAFLALHRRRPAYGVIFSVQRDSGSASKAARKLIGMDRDRELPTAVVLAGPGWAPRSETAELVAAFDGRVFSDSALPRLAQEIRETIEFMNKQRHTQ